MLTIENGVASVQTELVLQLLLPVRAVRISRVCNPPVRLHERRGPEVLVLVPPVARAARRAARTQDALVQPVELLAVVLALQELALRGRVVVLEVRLDALVLLVEEREVGHEVLDDVHVRERVDLGVRRGRAVDAAEARERVLPVDVHRARAADALAAGAAEGERRVDLVLDFDERI